LTVRWGKSGADIQDIAGGDFAKLLLHCSNLCDFTLPDHLLIFEYLTLTRQQLTSRVTF